MTIPMWDYLSNHSGTILYVLGWAIALGALFVVPFRRTAEAARSWLLIFFVQPFIALFLYWIIGRPNFPKWRRKRFQGLEGLFDRIGDELTEDAPVPPDIDTAITNLAEKLGQFPAVGGNKVELIPHYVEVIDRLVADIDAAKEHVRILVYIFASDATGMRVIDALGRAVKRGVACHVLIDPMGSRQWVKDVVSELRQEGVHVRLTLPFRFGRQRTRRDMRNHRKLFIIDGDIGYAGSQNLVDRDFAPGIINRELVARVEGPVVAEMTAIFLTDWYLETEDRLVPSIDLPRHAGSAVAQMLPSGASYRVAGFETLLTWQVHEAQSHIILVTPYFIPDEGLIEAMRTAVLRGVTVDLVVSAVVDQHIVHLAQSSYYEDLLAAGVRIHKYRSFLLHAKNVSIDGELGVIGSSNIDIRSFLLNEEVSLLLHDRDTVAQLEDVQRDYLDNSDLVDPEAWKQRSIFRKTAENIAQQLSPLL